MTVLVTVSVSVIMSVLVIVTVSMSVAMSVIVVIMAVSVTMAVTMLVIVLFVITMSVKSFTQVEVAVARVQNLHLDQVKDQAHNSYYEHDVTEHLRRLEKSESGLK